MHGGLGGPPKGNRNAVKHGIYAEVLPEAERKVYDRIEIGSLEDEIRMTRVKLRRALEQQAIYDAVLDSNLDFTKLRDKLELREIRTVMINGQPQQTEIKRSVRDFRREINNFTRLIADLEMKQATLGSSGGGNAEEIAFKIREALHQMDVANGVAFASTTAETPG